MKNKNFKIIPIILLMGILFASFNFEKVSAKPADTTFYNGEWIYSTYIKKLKNGVGRYETARFLRRADGQFAYCLQPFIEFGEGYVMTAYDSDYEIVSNMTYEQWNRVSLLAYYGYQYGNHNDSKWYIITQMMIWQTVDPNSDIFFTDTLNGNRISLYTSEMYEIEMLVANHYKRPSFNGYNYRITVGESLTLTDVNNVLSNYTITSSPNVTANIVGNTLNVTANDFGKVQLQLEKRDTKYFTAPIVYVKNSVQDLMVAGSYDPIPSNINIDIVGAKIKITKVDSETLSSRPQGQASMVGAVYEVLDSNSNVVDTVTIGSDSTALTKELPFGNYTVREKSSGGKGYYLDNTTYSVQLLGMTPITSLAVKEQVIKSRIKVTKVDSETNTCTPSGQGVLVGAKYGVYDWNDKFIEMITIGEDCTGTSSELPYGKYKVKEVYTSGIGYNIDSTIYEANITNSNTINITSKEQIIKSRIKIKKVDSETNTCTPSGQGVLVGAKYGIYDWNNKLVETLTIGNDCTATSKEHPYGKYKVKEISTSGIGYKIDSTTYEANITNSEIINITSKEEIIKGRIKILKVDSITKNCKARGEATLIGAVFDIIDPNGKVVDTLTIGDDCTATSKLLPYSNYSIKEKSNSIGYYINTNTFTKFIKEEKIYSITVEEDVIENQFNFYKFYSNENTGIIYAEPNAIFDIINNKNEVITSFVTDKNGYASVMLPYGNYIIKQKSGLDNYKLMYPFNVTVNEQSSLVQNNYLKNGSITARLKLIKIDSETKQAIPVSGVKFKIKDKLTNDYVCQTTDKVICEYATNDEGILITPLPLFAGNYLIEEISAPHNYLLSDELVEFSIKENTEIIEDSIYGSLVEVEFENTPVKGKVEIYKTGEKLVLENNTFKYEEIKLPNVIFGIYDLDMNLVTTVLTDENGYASIDNLKLGKYFLKELESSNNNLIDENIYSFELKYKDQYTPVITKTFNLKNYLPKSELQFTKIDVDTDSPISNVKIQIYTENDNLIYEGKTDKNGKILVKELFIGNFYILESEANTGYKLNQEKIFFEIKEDSEVIKTTMTNEKIKGTLEFTKVDLSTSEAIPNTLIEIYKEDTDELIYSGRTDEKGNITIDNIEYGKYYILEKECIGYVLNDEKMYFEVKEDGEIIKTTMTNEKIKGTLEFTKLDLSTSEAIPNTLIEIYKEDTDELIYSGRTDEKGNITIDNIEYGKYYILEKECVGYVLNDEKMYFEVKEDGEIIKTTMTNEKIKGTLEFTKLYFSTREPIPNTLIEIYKEDTNELIYSERTDEKGNITIDDIEYGKYYILEKECIGYILNDEKMYFEIKENGEVIKSTMENKKITSIIKIHKVDENNNPLPGVIIGIYDLDDNLVYSSITDENGYIETELEYNSYYFKELKGLDNYILNTEKYFFDVVNNEEIIEMNLVNEFEKIEVPDTGIYVINKYIYGSLLIIIGLGIIYVCNKKKN